MRRWLLPPLFVTAIAAFSFSLATPTLQAQDKEKAAPPEEETFLTADGMQLHGLFHKSAKSPGNDPVVILLYPPGKDNDMTKGDWGGLANRLTTSGFNVFRFDWRGHGKSTEIKNVEKFWGNPFTGPWNKRYISTGKKSVKDALFVKDLGQNGQNLNAYMPVFLTDLAAVRAHLDSKNDGGDVNTSSIYIIGAEQAAGLGFAWLATEWNRPAFCPTNINQLLGAPGYSYVPQPILNKDIETGGSDFSGVVWLTASRPASISETMIKSFVTGLMPNGATMPFAPKIRDNNPMLFMYGANDKKGEKDAAFFHKVALAAHGGGSLAPLQLADKLMFPVKNGASLTGVKLLGNADQLGTETTIMNFLDKIQKDRKQITRKPRNYTGPCYIKLELFGFMLPF